jgi:hypothetical protein
LHSLCYLPSLYDSLLRYTCQTPVGLRAGEALCSEAKTARMETTCQK